VSLRQAQQLKLVGEKKLVDLFEVILESAWPNLGYSASGIGQTKISESPQSPVEWM
jgi:hypothetical protein